MKKLAPYVLCFFAVLVIGIVYFIHRQYPESGPFMMYFGVAFCIGSVAGGLELLQRFSVGAGDATIFRTYWSWLYMAFNACGAAFAAMLAMPSSIEFDVKTFVSGIGFGMLGIAALRGTVKIDGLGGPIGLAPLLDQLKNQVEVRVDGFSGRALFGRVAAIMKNVDFSLGRDKLIAGALLMREHYSDEDRRKLKEDVDQLEGFEGQLASIYLGMIVARVVGPEALELLVNAKSSELVWQAGPELDELRETLYNSALRNDPAPAQ